MYKILLLLSMIYLNISAQGNLCIVGGGGEDYDSWSDKPYSWIVENSFNKKILILSYSDATNWLPNYFKSLGAATADNLMIDSREKADDETIADKILEADGVFIKGGDQNKYITFWKGTRTEQAIIEVYNRGGVIAGTSAGAMVLSEFTFSAANGTVDPRDVLIKIHSPKIIFEDDFLPLLPNVVFDTHFAERGRIGRLLSFMMNLKSTRDKSVFGIGVDDKTALCIDSLGQSIVYGSGAVTICRFDEKSNFEEIGDKYTMSNILVHHLVEDWKYDFNTNRIIAYSLNSREFKSNFILQSNSTITLSNSYDINFNSNLVLPQFIGERINEKFLFINSEDSKVAFDELKERLNAMGLKYQSVMITNDKLNDEELAAEISNSENLILFSSNKNLFSEMGNTQYIVSQAFQKKVNDKTPVLFMENISAISSPQFIYNEKNDPYASYYGELKTFGGMNILPSVILQAGVYDEPDHYENSITGGLLALKNSLQPYLIYQDHYQILEYDGSENTVANVSGSFPLFLVNASNAEIIDSSEYVMNGGAATRQIIGINNLRYTISKKQIEYSLEHGEIITSINNKESKIISKIKLKQNYPNPFNPNTTIEYNIMPNVMGEMSKVNLKVYNILGVEIATLVNVHQPSGTYKVNFYAEDFASGIYLYRLSVGSSISTKKMILLK